jgi:hypothetical protein
LQNQRLELFLKNQQCSSLRQRSVFATHLTLLVSNDSPYAGSLFKT